MKHNLVSVLRNIEKIYVYNEISSDEYYSKFVHGIDKDTFLQIVAADPTSIKDTDNSYKKIGEYTKWLLSLYSKNKLRLEDLYKATDYLTIFHEKKKRGIIPQNQRDILQYKSLPDLYDVVSQYEEERSKREITKEQDTKIEEGKSDIVEIFNDGNWHILIPKTKEASIYWGKGTQWCTAPKTENNMFESYNKDGDLIIFIRGEQKYQLHFESQQLTDKRDEDVDPIRFFNNVSDDAKTGFYQNYLKQYLKKGIRYLKIIANIKSLDAKDDRVILYYTLREMLEEFVNNKDKNYIHRISDRNSFEDDIYIELGINIEDIIENINEKNKKKIISILNIQNKDIESYIAENKNASAIRSILYDALVESIYEASLRKLTSIINRKVKENSIEQVLAGKRIRSKPEFAKQLYKFTFHIPADVGYIVSWLMLEPLFDKKITFEELEKGSIYEFDPIIFNIILTKYLKEQQHNKAR